MLRLGRFAVAGLGLAVMSVVLIGLCGGFLISTMRVSSLVHGALADRVGSSVEAELTVTGVVRAVGGWQSATAVVTRLSERAGAPSVASAASGTRAPETAGNAGKGATAGSAVTAATSRASDPGVGEKVLLEVPPADRGAPVLFVQGSLVKVRGKIQAPEGPSSSGFDQRRQLYHQGIQVVLEAESNGGVQVVGQRGGMSGWFDKLRSSATAHLALGPDHRVDEVLQGVVMGDTAGIDPGWAEAFRRAGTAHMLSVGGLHIASLAAIVIALAALAGASRRVGFLMTAATALFMIPFVGPSPPVVRSAITIIIVVGGRWVGRRRDQWQALAFAAVVVLALNPFSVFDVGFQLSFAAIAGMLALTRPLQGLFTRLPAGVSSNLAVSVAATVGTAPISLAVFGRTSIVAPLANLLVVPALPAVTGLGMASAFLGFVWSGFSVGLDALASLPMSWIILGSRFFAGAPVLGVAQLGRALFALGAIAVLLPVAFALRGRVVATPAGLRPPFFKRTVAWAYAHRPKKRRPAAVLAVVVVLIGALLGAAFYPVAPRAIYSVQTLIGAGGWPDRVEVRVLDVGQGTAVLVRTPGRHALLFDAGPSGCGLSAQLRGLGVAKLDLVVVSHPHLDHFGGLLDGLDGIRVVALVDGTQLIDPGVTGPASRTAPASAAGSAAAPGAAEALKYLSLRKELIASGAKYTLAATGSSVAADGVTIRFFAPRRPLVLLAGNDPWAQNGGPLTGDELNGDSLVGVLSAGGVDVLLPGDAEAGVLEAYHLPAVGAVVVSHHGSRGAVSQSLLAALRPRVALISVGKDNTFGHPDPSTLALLTAAGDTVVRTDERGWVCLRLKNSQMTLSAERTRAP